MRLRRTPRRRWAGAAVAGASAVAVAVGVGGAARPSSPEPQAASSTTAASRMRSPRLTPARMADALEGSAQRRGGHGHREGAAPDQHRAEAPGVGSVLHGVALVARRALERAELAAAVRALAVAQVEPVVRAGLDVEVAQLHDHLAVALDQLGAARGGVPDAAQAAAAEQARARGR